MLFVCMLDVLVYCQNEVCCREKMVSEGLDRHKHKGRKLAWSSKSWIHGYDVAQPTPLDFTLSISTIHCAAHLIDVVRSRQLLIQLEALVLVPTFSREVFIKI